MAKTDKTLQKRVAKMEACGFYFLDPRDLDPRNTTLTGDSVKITIADLVDVIGDLTPGELNRCISNEERRRLEDYEEDIDLIGTLAKTRAQNREKINAQKKRKKTINVRSEAVKMEPRTVKVKVVAVKSKPITALVEVTKVSGNYVPSQRTK